MLDLHTHKLDETGVCACGVTHRAHARTHTGMGRGPVYVQLAVGVNSLRLVEQSCNVPDVGLAIVLLEDAIGLLREMERRGAERRSEDRRAQPRTAVDARRRMMERRAGD